MTATLMPIRPQHLVNVLNGKKTLEIRKSVPKDFKGWVYLYVTKSTGGRIAMNKPYLFMSSTEKDFLKACNADIYLLSNLKPIRDILNGTIPCRFWFDEYDTHPFVDVSIPTGYEDWDGNFVDTTEEEMGYYITGDDLDKMCLSYNEVANYGKSKDLYALHIKQLEIFDEPKSLTEFKKWTKKIIYSGMDCPPYVDDVLVPVTKAPQSYMFVEVKE
jgi:predicted transcriptional regulator